MPMAGSPKFAAAETQPVGADRGGHAATSGDHAADFREAAAWPSLRAAAVAVLSEPCPFEKARLTRAAVQRWRCGALPVRLADDMAIVPDAPARPADVSVVSKGKVKSGSMKAMLHGVCHAESYAIDLMWDSVARFADDDGEGGPSPPHEFFDEWVSIASDEARHFCGWAKHMEDHYGTRYGDLPTHEMLWEVAYATRGSLRARLAVVHLIHEARGLDAAPIMRARCLRARDTAAAEMLDRNIRDEVRHVGAGARWFRALSGEELGSAGDATSSRERTRNAFLALARQHYHGALKRPFNTALREEAGLPEAWYLPLAEAREAAADPGALPVVSAVTSEPKVSMRLAKLAGWCC